MLDLSPTSPYRTPYLRPAPGCSLSVSFHHHSAIWTGFSFSVRSHGTCFVVLYNSELWTVLSFLTTSLTFIGINRACPTRTLSSSHRIYYLSMFFVNLPGGPPSKACPVSKLMLLLFSHFRGSAVYSYNKISSHLTGYICSTCQIYTDLVLSMTGAKISQPMTSLHPCHVIRIDQLESCIRETAGKRANQIASFHSLRLISQ